MTYQNSQRRSSSNKTPVKGSAGVSSSRAALPTISAQAFRGVERFLEKARSKQGIKGVSIAHARAVERTTKELKDAAYGERPRVRVKAGKA